MTSDQYDVNNDQVLRFELKRVWSKDGKRPAKALGVCADPECSTVPIPCQKSIFILGIDGLFNSISNEEVCTVVSKHCDPVNACRRLVGIAYNRWSESEERTDDVTVIVGHIKRTPDTAFWGIASGFMECKIHV